MIDHETLLVAYRAWRGEPRGPHKKGQPWEGRGDCIDCRACVAVCPTGIDIRDGSQLECIQCALCIDACNEIMSKVGRPRGLIAYDTIPNLEAAAKGGSRAAAARASAHGALRRPDLPGRRRSCWRRSRTAARSRSTCCTTAIRPTCCCPTAACATAIRSRSSTSCTTPRSSRLEVHGLPGARLAIVGMDAGASIRVATDALRELKVFVTVPAAEVARIESWLQSVQPGCEGRGLAARDGARHAVPEARRNTREATMSPTVLPTRRRQQGVGGRHVLMVVLGFFGVVFRSTAS